MDPSRTAETMHKARERRRNGEVMPNEDITIALARAALEIADPQIVIDSALSREWSNSDPDARWRKGRAKLQEGFRALPEAGPLKPQAEAELYRQINNLMAHAPGSVASDILDDELQEALQSGSADAPDVFSEIAKESGLAFLQMTADDLRRMNETIVNLTGEGPAERWRKAVKQVIISQFKFAQLRLKLEQSINVLSPVAILGLEKVEQLEVPRQWSQSQQPDPTKAQEWFNVLKQAGTELFENVAAIAATQIEGEPSVGNSLDTVLAADLFRLREVLATLIRELQPRLNNPNDPNDEVLLEATRRHTTELGEMVNLARRYSDGQYAALLNKLSRAFQKPDFCLRRDAFGDDADRLLPRTLSWDGDWYYGQKISLADTSIQVPSTAAPGGTPPRPATNPPAAGPSPQAPTGPPKARTP